MPAERYWLWLHEKQSGPFSIAQIGDMASAEPPSEDCPTGEPPEITGETLYWSDRLQDWRPLKLLPRIEWEGGDDKERLESIQSADIEWVEYLNAQNGQDCPFCVSMNGKRFRASEAPSMPLAGCTCSPWPISVWIAVEGP
jgi:hypothetical protein